MLRRFLCERQVFRVFRACLKVDGPGSAVHGTGPTLHETFTDMIQITGQIFGV